jgi:prepilin peptidase CpaA
MTLVLTTAAIALFLTAAITDVAGRRIPNRIVTCLAAVGIVRLVALLAAAPALGAAWTSAAVDLGVALAVFGAGAAVFHLNLLGGGDVKLLAAGALWLGAASLWPFLVVTAVAGGVLALAYIALSAAGRAEARAGLPYGVAIATGGIFATLAAA